ncbi:PLP-dependent transferase [Guyanagaster necrorhizus]|uniref:PLP-dependent transferase n=1 Tax=Guyanagaster necrorhizus TaxID=856835 RepID=A0A9P7VVZ0_9AGAR|nr:PLP-dependent transferase [Guyanagaster necrorhizus MCA 3950]KAG7448531.1 PLP-dependent transferase [Guyanagaster necrorhizus MCA 3950]
MSATTTVVENTAEVALGLSVPPFTPHAISVSLPTWRDNVGYEEGEKRVVDLMVSGYPRFFVHLSIRKLAGICEHKFGAPGESCMLFPTHKTAEHCRGFIQARSAIEGTPVSARLIQFMICPEDNTDAEPTGKCADLHIVLYPSSAGPLAKQFWQHTGLGISSRLADYCLSLLPVTSPECVSSPILTRPGKAVNRHYSAKGFSKPKAPQAESLSQDHSVYLEERYGRNLPFAYAASAKRALRRRISGVLRDAPSDNHDEPAAGHENLIFGPSSRGVSEVTEGDVFLYPTGMSAIWSAHMLALAVRPNAKSICFGQVPIHFPYADTLKVLEKWGPGCYFFGHGLNSDLDALEAILEEEAKRNLSKPPVLSLFTEFPSNPLLRSADLPRIHTLAKKYDFLVVVDETIGNFMNVEVLTYADIVVSSLTKIFSGAANVMGGSLTLNPRGRHYAALKAHLDATYEDVYFEQDAVFLERNSRDSLRRIRVIDENTEAVCNFLRERSIAGGAPEGTSVVKEVYYPKYVTPELYEKCRIKGDQPGGYGGLFSLTFTTSEASQAFFDTLPFYKGPSLGTNFTLASPYVVLAHYAELDWVAKYDVDPGLVRISVGMEDKHHLLESIGKALKAAEETLTSTR